MKESKLNEPKFTITFFIPNFYFKYPTVHELLNDWDLYNHLNAPCCDTNTSNTRR